MAVITEGGASTEWQRKMRWVVEYGFWADSESGRQESFWVDAQNWLDAPQWVAIQTGDRTDEV